MQRTAGGSATSLDDRPRLRHGRAALSLHRLDDEAWLLDRCGQRLFHLNSMAALIWSAHLAGLADAEIARLLARRHCIAPGEAAGYVAETLCPWLLEDGSDSATDECAPAPHVALGEVRVVETYRVLDAVISLGFADSDLHARIHPSLGALAVAGASAPSRRWRIGTVAGGYALAEDGRLVDRCERADQLAPMLKLRLVYAALDVSRDACALHAAALGAGAKCVLLPGRSGAGRSLAAGLVSAGFTLLGDDTVVMADGVPAVRPLPLPIALKAGSWMMLSGRIAGLLDLPIHWRPDGKAVRYVAPPVAARPASSPLPIGWIVFPAFASGRAPALERLGAGPALKRLMAGLAPLGAGLTPATLERLIGWIRGVPCFELRYGALDDAVAALQGALPMSRSGAALRPLADCLSLDGARAHRRLCGQPVAWLPILHLANRGSWRRRS